MTDHFVTIVIPAYNAARTLDETLRSARLQTYPHIEIIVVDDGSTDGTVEIAHWHAREDSRIRVLQQTRGGPSAARNRAIKEAKGDLIAPLDADDLWQTTKIERQVRALAEGGERVGLVYTWFALIDEKDRIRSMGHCPTDAGDVLRICCRRSLVGNGSGALMRKSAILECGGYDETLQSCEDLKLYTAIAARYHYAVVPDYLTGYRQSNRNLTSKAAQMQRSAETVIRELEANHPQYRDELREMRRSLYQWLFARAVVGLHPGDAWALAHVLWKVDRPLTVRSVASVPKLLLMQFWYLTGRRVARGLRREGSGFTVRRFSIDPSHS